MQKIKELRPGGHIEVKAEIISIQPVRKLWKCFSCGHQGLWRKEEEFSKVCPDCGQEESETSGKGLWIQELTSALIKDDSGLTYLDLWKDEIKQFKIGDKVHIINGFARENSNGGVNVSKGKFGTLRKIE